MDKLTQHPAADAAKLESSDNKPFSLGDQVVIVDKHGAKVKGKVKWTGTHKKIDVLGIEAVSNLLL